MLWFDARRTAVLFLPFALLYQLVVMIRNFLYDKQILPVYRPKCRVISVGNITVGGTGKTPAVQLIVNELKRRGITAVIISRGYARKSRGAIIVSDGVQILADAKKAGDEPLLLARNCPGVPVIVDADRVHAAQLAERFYHPQVIVLDDGFQHRRLARDFDLLTMRAVSPLGNGWCLPAGPLREPSRSIKRVDFVLLTGGKGNHQALQPRWLGKPWTTAEYRFQEAIDGRGNVVPLEVLKRHKAAAFCGLANPAGFFDMLRAHGINAVVKMTFADHYYYTEQDVQNITKRGQEAGASFFLTTEKDWVKLNGSKLGPQWLVVRIALHVENFSNIVSRIEKLIL